MIGRWLVERGILPGARILDAGCGTVRYSTELARRGYIVQGVDLSPELVEVARQSICEPAGAVSFEVGDILGLPSQDPLTCPDSMAPAFRQRAGSAKNGPIDGVSHWHCRC